MDVSLLNLFAIVGELEVTRRTQAEALAKKVTDEEAAELAALVRALHEGACICRDGHDCPYPDLPLLLTKLSPEGNT